MDSYGGNRYGNTHNHTRTHTHTDTNKHNKLLYDIIVDPYEGALFPSYEIYLRMPHIGACVPIFCETKGSTFFCSLLRGSGTENAGTAFSHR